MQKHSDKQEMEVHTHFELSSDENKTIVPPFLGLQNRKYGTKLSMKQPHSFSRQNRAMGPKPRTKTSMLKTEVYLACTVSAFLYFSGFAFARPVGLTNNFPLPSDWFTRLNEEPNIIFWLE